jgi:hypothetical protein
MVVGSAAVGSQGPEVAALQRSLVTLCLLKPEKTLEELVDSRFGDVTLDAVIRLQTENGLPPTGICDYSTSELIRRLLLQAEPDPDHFVVGRILGPSSKPAYNICVQVFHRSLRQHRSLGETTTNGRGCYVVRYNRKENSPPVDLAVHARDSDGRILYEPALDKVVFNASRLSVVNITLAIGDTRILNQFTKVSMAIKPFLDGTTISKLRQDAELQDVTYLSKQTSLSTDVIAHLVVAHKLEAKYKIPPAVSYALLAENSLVSANVDGAAPFRFEVDSSTPLEPLFYDMVLLPHDTIFKTVESASSVSHLVPVDTEKLLPVTFRILKEHADDAQKYIAEQRSAVILSQLVALVTPSNVAAILDVLSTNAYGNFGSILQRFDETFSSKMRKPATHFDSTLFVDGPLIDLASRLKKVKGPQELARFGQLDWEHLFTLAGSKSKVHAAAAKSKVVNLHAAGIARTLEKRFPMQAFTGELERDSTALTENRDDILHFLDNHPDFDLSTSNVDQVVSKSSVEFTHRESKQKIKALQRVFKFVPTFRHTKVLLDNDLSSAAHIHALGDRRFIEIAGRNGIFSADEARKTFRKASDIHIASGFLAGQIGAFSNSSRIAALSSPEQVQKLTAVTQDFPNLKSLFDFGDFCACSDCSSMTSASAYLVAVLEFLKQRKVINTTASTTHSAKDVLFKRRPDLGDIDLSCPNTNIPFPYIDAVCEVLENAVAPSSGLPVSGDIVSGLVSSQLLGQLAAAGLPFTPKAVVYDADLLKNRVIRDEGIVCKLVPVASLGAPATPTQWMVYILPQTYGSAEALAAAPNYINVAAYHKLMSSNFAFLLPFDLSREETAAYFAQFGIPRVDLLRALASPTGPTSLDIAGEDLGLSVKSINIITTVKPAQVDQEDYWNTADAVSTVNNIQLFLDKTSLTFTELEELLSLDWINPENRMFVKYLKNNCNLRDMQIENLDYPALDRFHRFIRLRNALSTWSWKALDQAIRAPSLGNGLLDGKFLEIVSATNQLRARLSRYTLDQIVACFDNISTSGGAKSPYASIFLTKASVGTVNDAFKPDRLDAGVLLSAHKEYLALCLGLNVSDTIKLIETISPLATIELGSLSKLQALNTLARGFKLNVSDLAILQKLTGVNILAGPKQALLFSEMLAIIRNAKVSPVDLQNILSRQPEYPDVSITGHLKAIQTAFVAARVANMSPFDSSTTADENAESALPVLSKLPSVAESDLELMRSLFKNEWKDANLSASDFLDQFWNRVSQGMTAPDATGSSISIPDRQRVNAAYQSLSSLPPSSSAAVVESARKTLIQVVSDVTVQEFEARAKRIAVLDALKPLSIMDDLLVVFLNHAKLDSRTLFDILTDDAINAPQTTAPNSPLVEPSTATMPLQYRTIRFLKAMDAFAKTFSIQLGDIRWMLQKNATVGWPLLDDTVYTFQSWAFLQDYPALLAKFPPVENLSDSTKPYTVQGLFEHAIQIPAVATQSILQYFSHLSGLDLDTLVQLASRFSLAAVDFHLPKTFLRLERAAVILRTMGMDAASAISLIKPQLMPADASLMRRLLKARYADSDWFDILRSLYDPLRRKKRDALIAYLLATNPDISSTNDLYDYFLIDVKMGSCMETSRIVQGHATVQLFVQRCMMGLEPESVADTEHDSAWAQWKWMEQYQIWKANVLVWLFPENWIQPSLRDDKSEIFVELENSIAQSKLTDEAIETAASDYLVSLDNVAHLDVMATYCQTENHVTHVFARTKGGDPRTYYYRQLHQERSWTPWEKLNLDIKGNHLITFDRNSRLCLAWPVFTIETEPPKPVTVPAPSDIKPGGQTKTEVPNTRMVVQLAVSEFAGGAWKPPTVSQNALYFPSAGYQNFIPVEDDFNLFVWKLGPTQAISVSFNWAAQYLPFQEEFYELPGSMVYVGAFDLIGCRGYPEPTQAMDPFYGRYLPVFEKSVIATEKFLGYPGKNPGRLAVSTATSPRNPIPVLNRVIGNWRVTYPMQMSLIDWLVVTLQLLGSRRIYTMAVPPLFVSLGTFMPWFFADNSRTFVVYPGLYKDNDRRDVPAKDPVTALFSDIETVAEDALNLLQEYAQRYLDDPNHDTEKVLADLKADQRFVDIVGIVQSWAGSVLALQFKTFYHPLICSLRRTFNQVGFRAIMSRSVQQSKTNFDFGVYQPQPGVVVKPYPIEEISFAGDDAYSSYNWELFFHIPFQAAVTLSNGQQFAEAREWFHYIFNPAGVTEKGGTPAPNKYWMTKPFFERNNYLDQLIQTLMNDIAADPKGLNTAELKRAVIEWRNKPLQPHVIARSRTVAYQIAVVLSYVKNLLDWGDVLFTQFTRETITRAMQLYVLAEKLLGPKPGLVKPAVTPPQQTYNQLEGKIDYFGNALLDLENLIPDLDILPHKGAELPHPTPPSPVALTSLYFCLPQNDEMLKYWDLVADRLFKIRNCQNIDGVYSPLALFSPPIDPGALVRAAAAGIDAVSMVQGLNAPLPIYRFTDAIQRAESLARQVSALGASLLQALERRDAEEIVRLQSSQQLGVLAAIRKMKADAVTEGQGMIDNIIAAQVVLQERHDYFNDQVYMNDAEFLTLLLTLKGMVLHLDIADMHDSASDKSKIPTFGVGIAGFGGSPTYSASWGGGNMASAKSSSAAKLTTEVAAMDKLAALVATQAIYQRRAEEWKHQVKAATAEIEASNQQIATARLHLDVLKDDLAAHDKSVEQQKMIDELFRSKYTNKELYDWMVGQMKVDHRAAYDMALTAAIKAERCFRHEIGNSISPPLIKYDGFDSTRSGLMAGNILINDINRLNEAYRDQNRRELELSKRISIAQLDPLALLQLRTTGSCTVSIPESVFDMDHPGQYMRRHKAVSVSIPCVVGPHTSVTCTLSLISNRYRHTSQLSRPDYAEEVGADLRFTYNVGVVQSIATSTANEDAGVFDLNFRDERYLPFEGTGCIATWSLELPSRFRQFDYSTISDVLLHLRYTARRGGANFRQLVEDGLQERLNTLVLGAGREGLFQGYNMRMQYPNEWFALLESGAADLVVGPQHLPFWAQAHAPEIDAVTWYVASRKEPAQATRTIHVDGATVVLKASSTLTNVLVGSGSAVTLGKAFKLSDADPKSLVALNFIVRFKLTA